MVVQGGGTRRRWWWRRMREGEGGGGGREGGRERPNFPRPLLKEVIPFLERNHVVTHNLCLVLVLLRARYYTHLFANLVIPISESERERERETGREGDTGRHSHARTQPASRAGCRSTHNTRATQGRARTHTHTSTHARMRARTYAHLRPSLPLHTPSLSLCTYPHTHQPDPEAWNGWIFCRA